MNLKKYDTLNLHIGAYLSALGSVEMKKGSFSQHVQQSIKSVAYRCHKTYMDVLQAPLIA